MQASAERWLPTTKKEVQARGWDSLDVILFSGDAYIDHPSFGIPVIGRLLESMGLKVAIVPQPNWRDDLRDFKKLGRPNLFFGVSAGVMDSMVNHYTAGKRLRSNDAYTPGNQAGFRPDYATKVYTNILKDIFPDVPVIIGGVEASLRRFTHYDYWQDSLQKSMLVQSGADLLVYGMGEKPLREIVTLLQKGVPFDRLTTIQQTAVLCDVEAGVPKRKGWETIELASHDECVKDKKAFAKNFTHIETESNKMNPARLVQPVDDKILVVNPAWSHLTEAEMDEIYDLPYTRMPHPKYHGRGDIQAWEMIKFSVNIHRGCFGGCSFCTISTHQGKFISSRSEKSVLKEVEQVKELPGFKGYISDIGGPSANMYKMEGIDLNICASCKRPSCIYPSICKNLGTSHKPLTELYKKVNNMPGIKKAFVGSGIRYDMLLNDYNKRGGGDLEEYLKNIVQNHVSGRLKVAPEHTDDEVLKIMRKPSFSLFHKFKKLFEKYSNEAGLKQQIIPYFISSHPNSTEIAMAELAAETKSLGMQLEQVQDFTPTPMTLATVMYYTGLNPYTMKPVYTARTKEQKQRQHMFFFHYKKEFRDKINKHLIKLKRSDLAKKLIG